MSKSSCSQKILKISDSNHVSNETYCCEVHIISKLIPAHERSEKVGCNDATYEAAIGGFIQAFSAATVVLREGFLGDLKARKGLADDLRHI